MSTFDGLGSRLTELINNTGLSQNEFSSALGISAGFVSDVARGVKKPGSEFLHGLRETFNVSIDWLLTGTGTMFGGNPVELELFKLIVAEIALARAALTEGDAKAQQLVARLLAQDEGASLRDPKLLSLLQQYANNNEEALLAAVLYNSHLWSSKADERVRNALSGALAYFQSKRPLDILKALQGKTSEGAESTGDRTTKAQVNVGKSVRAAGRDFYERTKPSRGT